MNPWITLWALALVKGIREPHKIKKNSFCLGGNRTHDLRIRSAVTLPTELRDRTEKVGDDLIYTSELILCSPFVFLVLRGTTFICTLTFSSRDSPPKSSPAFSVRPRSSVDRVTVDLIRRSWVRFPSRSKEFFFTSCGSPIPFTRANAQWVIHGFNLALTFTLQS